MAQYYSTFLSGTSDIVEVLLKKDLKDINVMQKLDGLIEYSTATDVKKLKSLKYLNNTFQILYKLRSAKRNAFEETIEKILLNHSFDKKINLPKGNFNNTFRIVVSDENNLVKINKELLLKIENKIATNFSLRVHRAKPNYQFWILKRSEGGVYFSLRLTKIQKKDKERSKGELKPQLAYILAAMSDPQEGELFLDPFCGSGSIPLARASMTRKGLILASDIEESLTSKLKEKVKCLGLKNKIVVKTVDALKPDSYKDSSIHKIVTDPPWGYYKHIVDLQSHWEKILSFFERILIDNGVLVVLLANDERFFKVFSQTKNFLILKSYTVLVSGRKALILKIKKTLKNA